MHVAGSDTVGYGVGMAWSQDTRILISSLLDVDKNLFPSHDSYPSNVPPTRWVRIKPGYFRRLYRLSFLSTSVVASPFVEPTVFPFRISYNSVS